MSEMLQSKRFWLGLVIRLVCIPIFYSHYSNNLFLPFLDATVQHPLSNPWNNFPAEFFPYGSVLFSLLFVPKFIAYKIIGTAALGTGAISLTLMKLPLLVMDIVLLSTLMFLSPRKRYEVYLYYWFNPILIFITYIHCQLDVCAIAFLFLSLKAVLERRVAKAGVHMAFATLCKFHVILAVPVVMVFLWNRYFAKQAYTYIAKYLGSWTSISFLGFIPLFAADKFLYAAASSPQAQQLLAWKMTVGQNSILYVGMAAVIAVLGRLCIARPITEDGLVYGVGFLLGTLLLVTNPAAGWFFWLVPFVALFYSNYVSIPRSLYFISSAAYLVNFAILPLIISAENKHHDLAFGVSFTVMQACFSAIMLFLWQKVLSKQAPISRFANPTMIGIAGDSGAGKNTLSALLQGLFDTKQAAVIEGDDYHKWERGNNNWQEYTHLNPKANHLGQLAAHMQELQTGKRIFQPHYDHATGVFTAPQELKPGKTIIVQGLHTLYLRSMRDSLDLKIFLNPEREVRLLWKLQRDVHERGHSIEKILQTLQLREKDSNRHILPQRNVADWIIEYFLIQSISEEEIITDFVRADKEYGLRCFFWNDAPVADVLSKLNTHCACSVSINSYEKDFSRIQVDIIGEPSVEKIQEVADICFSSMREITLGREAPKFSSGLSGVTQLLALALLRHRESRMASHFDFKTGLNPAAEATRKRRSHLKRVS